MPTEINPAIAAMTDAEAEATARQIITDFATSYRDPRPLPTTGTAPPVPQPGRPAMSEKATNASVVMLSAGATSLLVSGGASLVMLTSGYADPVVIASICAAPAALAVPILALSRLLKTAGQAAPPEHHHHYNGPVQNHNQTVHNHNRLLGKSATNL
ncbi:hypothetical protein [Streptomyces sp. NPDC002994]|uniref:hypothetical protein n=1 Tax=Streptomyces sp. NPDC002994 TaxID=3154441 RepID=UPI0033A53C8D